MKISEKIKNTLPYVSILLIGFCFITLTLVLLKQSPNSDEFNKPVYEFVKTQCEIAISKNDKALAKEIGIITTNVCTPDYFTIRKIVDTPDMEIYDVKFNILITFTNDNESQKVDGNFEHRYEIVNSPHVFVEKSKKTGTMTLNLDVNDENF